MDGNAAYFVTICTKGRECFFGEIVDKKMQLSNVGILADVLWYEIKNHVNNVELDVFTVMPNHVHKILILNGSHGGMGNRGNAVGGGGGDNVGTTHVVETTHALSLRPPPPPQPPQPPQKTQTIGQKRFQNQGKNTLSSIVGSYKSAVTKHAHRLGFDFAWQSRFHDHIIRDAAAHERIARYITNNPAKWPEDPFNPKNPNKGK